jgi:hypothetical protein
MNDKELFCQKCETVWKISDIKLTQAGQHIKASCPMCDRFLKFLQQTPPSGDDVMPFGKHKGEKVSDIVLKDNNYAQWASEKLKGRYQEAFKICLKK